METKPTTVSEKNVIRERVQSEALTAIEGKYRAGIAVSMGVGKTRIALMDMVRMKKENIKSYRFLVVVPRLKIIEAYKTERLEINLAPEDLNIEYITYRSLCKTDLTKFDKIYLDECHSLTWSVEFPLAHFPEPILGMTGTPPKYPKSEKGYMVQEYCPIVFSYLLDEAVEDHVLNDYKLFVHALPLNKTPGSYVITYKKGGTRRMSETESYRELCSNIDDPSLGYAEIQMKRIFRVSGLKKYESKVNYLKSSLIPRLTGQNFKFLIFCNTQSQADLLSDPKIGSYHAGNKNSEANYDNFRSLSSGFMTCVDQIKEGVTIPGLNSVIIMHAYGNERNAPQKIGRMLRLLPEETAIGHILMYEGTVDQDWVKKSLGTLNHEKLKLFLPSENKAYPLIPNI